MHNTAIEYLLCVLLLVGADQAAVFGSNRTLDAQVQPLPDTPVGDRDPMGCKGPNSDARLRILSSTAAADRRFTLNLQNNSELPIRLLLLGSGEFRSWQADPGSEPEAVTSPPGWRGRLAFEHEGTHMTIVWVLLEATSYIAPGDDVTGFGFTLPAPAYQPLNLPFQAMFSGGPCVWGHLFVGEKLGNWRTSLWRWPSTRTARLPFSTRGVRQDNLLP